MPDQAVGQLENKLVDLAVRLGPVLGPDVQLAAASRARDRAARLIAQLADEDRAGETAANLLALLWPDGPDLKWWRTPLGLLCASAAAQEPDAAGWSRAEAAQVLGVSPGTVAQLTARGALEHTPSGQISRQSVLARLVRLVHATS